MSQSNPGTASAAASSAAAPTTMFMPASWAERGLSNDRPPCVGGHACCVSANGETLAIFGGADPFGVTNSALHIVDLRTGRAEACQPAFDNASAPARRSGHSMVCVPALLPPAGGSSGGLVMHVLVFGGVDYLPTPTVFSDVWLGRISRVPSKRKKLANQQPTAATETEQQQQQLVAQVQWQQLETAGGAAAGRHSFASCLVDDQHGGANRRLGLFVCGGGDGGSSTLAAPALLDLSPLLLSEQVAGGGTDATGLPLRWHAIAAPPTSGGAASFTPGEMCSAAYVPSLRCVLVAGGRDAQGNPIETLFACELGEAPPAAAPPPAECGDTTSGRGICFFPLGAAIRRIGSCPALGRICASLVPVAEGRLAGDGANGARCATVAVVGGVSANETISALPLDVAVDVASRGSGTELMRVRAIPRLAVAQQGAVAANFGVGHSATAYRAATAPEVQSAGGGAVAATSVEAEFVLVVVSGLFPNAIGHTMQVFVAAGVVLPSSSSS